MFEPFSRLAKDWEKTALALRRLAKIPASQLLDPWALAGLVGLAVMDGQHALSLIGEQDRVYLEGPALRHWSGGVYPTPLPDGTLLCILNPSHSPRRCKITLMEEVSHTYLRHRPSAIRINSDGIQVRDYDKAQETQAYGVGAAALLPWSTFFGHVNAGDSIGELAELYEVTPELIEYRIKITGAYKLYTARQRSRPVVI